MWNLIEKIWLLYTINLYSWKQFSTAQFKWVMFFSWTACADYTMHIHFSKYIYSLLSHPYNSYDFQNHINTRAITLNAIQAFRREGSINYEEICGTTRQFLWEFRYIKQGDILDEYLNKIIKHVAIQNGWTSSPNPEIFHFVAYSWIKIFEEVKTGAVQLFTLFYLNCRFFSPVHHFLSTQQEYSN